MKCILAYNPASKSANQLADAMRIPLVGRDVDLRRGGPNITVINWGYGQERNAALEACRVINPSRAVAAAVNKKEALDKLQAARVRKPTHTTDRAVADRWLRERTKVCARTRVEGRDGAGLVLVGPTDGWTAPVLPDAALYTKFIPSRAEFRVNTTVDKSIGVQLKVPDPQKRRTSEEIRTGGHGWAFRLLEEREIPRGLRPLAKQALQALGLTFGGVDIIHSSEDGYFYVLEVNTAPELTPAMVRGYAAQLANV